MSISMQHHRGTIAKSQRASAQERPATFSERALAGLEVLSTSAAAESATRRLARMSERRRQRMVTIVCAALVALGAFGTLTFASLLVSVR